MNLWKKIFLTTWILSFNAMAAPVITSLSPNHGPLTGATESRLIKGIGFTGTTNVAWGNNNLTTGFTVDSDTQITLPASSVPSVGEPGTVDVIITSASGVSTTSSDAAYVYQGDSFMYVTGYGGANDSTDPKPPLETPLSLKITGNNFSLLNPNPFMGPSLIQGNYVDICTCSTGTRAFLTKTTPSPTTSGFDLVSLGSQFQIINSGTLPAGTSPYSIAFSRDDKVVLIADNLSSVYVFLFSPNEPPTYIGQIPFSSSSTSFSFPTGIAIHPDSKIAYVTHYPPGNIGMGTIEVLDLSNLYLPTPQLPILFSSVPVQADPFDLSITSDGKRLVASQSGQIELFDVSIPTNPLSLGATVVSGGQLLSGVVISPDGKYAYAIDGIEQKLYIFQVPQIGPATFVQSIPIQVISADQTPVRIASRADGKHVYLLANSYLGNDGAPSAIWDVDVSDPTNPSPPIQRIDSTSSGLSSNYSPTGMAIVPDQAPLAAFTPILDGTQVTFDASESQSPVGTIASYVWDFGDGKTTTTTSPTILHNYDVLGSYDVTLTVTNSQGTSLDKVFTGKIMLRNGGPTATRTKTIELSADKPLTAMNLKGVQIVNKFLTEKDYVNVLTWSNPRHTSATQYQIYRIVKGTSELIGTISAGGKLRFEDHNRKKGRAYSYAVIAIDQAGQESSAATITVQSKK